MSDGAQIDWQNDPDFHALPLVEKDKVLMSVDNDYKSLPAGERAKALNVIHYGAKGTQFEQERTDESKKPGFFGGMKETIKGLIPHQMPPQPWMVGEKEKGYDPASPLMQSPAEWQRRKQEGRSLPYRTVAGAVELMPIPISPKSMEHSADIGDPGAIAGSALTGAAIAAAPLGVEGAYKGAAKGYGKLRYGEPLAATTAERATQNIKGALQTPPGKGGARAASMDRAIADTSADLSELERATPTKTKGPEAFKEVANKIDERQDALWDEHTKMMERHPDLKIDANAPIQSGRSVLTKVAKTVNEKEATAAESWLDSMSELKEAKDIDNAIREVNNDLKGKEVLGYGPLQIRVRQAWLKGARAAIENALVDEGEQGVKEVNRRWGALDEVRGRLEERAVQEFNKAATKGEMPDWLKVYAIMHPGAEGLPLAIGFGAKLNKMLAPSGGARLTRGLNQLGETGQTAPMPVNPRAYEDIAGRADYSSAEPVPYNRLARIPGREYRTPAPTITTPPKGYSTPIGSEPGGPYEPPTGREAQPITVREPNTGQMKRMYTGAERQPGVVPVQLENFPANPLSIPERRGGTTGMPRPGGATERRTPISKMEGPNIVRDAIARTLQEIIDDPTASARDKAIAKEQLKDLREHPFEKAGPESDIRNLRAGNKTK